MWSRQKLTHTTQFDPPPLCFAEVVYSLPTDYSPLRGVIKDNPMACPCDVDGLIIDDWQGQWIYFAGLGLIERGGKAIMYLMIENKHEDDSTLSDAVVRAFRNLQTSCPIQVHILHHERKGTPSGALLFNPTHIQFITKAGISRKEPINCDEYVARLFKSFMASKGK